MNILDFIGLKLASLDFLSSIRIGQNFISKIKLSELFVERDEDEEDDDQNEDDDIIDYVDVEEIEFIALNEENLVTFSPKVDFKISENEILSDDFEHYVDHKKRVSHLGY